MFGSDRLMDLDCPRCGTELEELSEEVRGPDIRVDRCPDCGSVFLDEGEIEGLTGHENVNELITTYLGTDADGELVCPSCGDPMDEEHFEGDEADVVIDVCIDCKGVWLDGGELEAIAALDDGKFEEVPDSKRAEAYDARLAEDRAQGRREIENVRRGRRPWTAMKTLRTLFLGGGFLVFLRRLLRR